MSRSLTDFDILCLSHLRWETTLFQRPQQIMSQFDSMGVPVVYASQWSPRRCLRAWFTGRRDELAGRSGRSLRWKTLPFLPGTGRSHWMEAQNVRFFSGRAARMVSARDNRPLLLWVYHPSYLPAADRIRHEALVYDCMDPFVAFRAERNKARVDEQEQELIRRANVVFTGGHSLQAAKEGTNPQTHCFPSGVDLPHFMKALRGRVKRPNDVADLPRPVFGYWGAVDERIDFGLIETLCQNLGEGSIVFLGPLVGMDRPPVDSPNFYYLGEKDYGILPSYLAAFDVCLLPFRISPLTSAMSPTKTPEYLAGGKPVVSTPLPDVQRVWGDVISIAETADEFAEAMARELRRPLPDPSLVEAARERAATWDQIGASMRAIIEDSLR